MIRQLTHDDYPQVLHIWQTCFGDSEDYVRFFWENALPHCAGRGYCADGALASMLFMLPGELIFPEDSGGAPATPTHYIYAVATLPEYRQRGIATKLLQHAAANGTSALALYPATAQLQRYYAKQGFVPAFRKQDSGMGKFAFSPAMQGFLQAEAALVGRDLTERDEFGGMLLALDEKAHEWLAQTQGQAYLQFTLE